MLNITVVFTGTRQTNFDFKCFWSDSNEFLWPSLNVIVLVQVPYRPAGPDTDSLEESGGDAALGEEGPTECDCEPGGPGFAGFAGPKV